MTDVPTPKTVVGSDGKRRLTLAGAAYLLEDAAEPAAELHCYCPDDCNCHYPWRPNYCGCRQHVKDRAGMGEP